MVVINNQIIDLLNNRIEQEEYSSRLYQSMSVWLKINGYEGAGKLWEKYSKEELIHANWAYNYLLSLDIKPNIPMLQAPPIEFKGLPQIVALSYKHELDITQQCQDLANLCMESNDFMTLALAQKYLTEQVDEINKLTNIATELDAFGTDKIALRLLDSKLGTL